MALISNAVDQPTNRVDCVLTINTVGANFGILTSAFDAAFINSFYLIDSDGDTWDPLSPDSFSNCGVWMKNFICTNPTQNVSKVIQIGTAFPGFDSGNAAAAMFFDDVVDPGSYQYFAATGGCDVLSLAMAAQIPGAPDTLAISMLALSAFSFITYGITAAPDNGFTLVDQVGTRQTPRSHGMSTAYKVLNSITPAGLTWACSAITQPSGFLFFVPVTPIPTPLRMTQLPIQAVYPYSVLQPYIVGNGRDWLTPRR